MHSCRGRGLVYVMAGPSAAVRLEDASASARNEVICISFSAGGSDWSLYLGRSGITMG